MNQAVTDHRVYLQSKEKLFGTIKSMILNKLDEIFTTRFIQLKAKFDGKITDVIITNDVAEEAHIITNSVDPLYPIQTWKERPSWF